MKLNLYWKTFTGTYTSVERLYINKIHIASCSYNTMRSKGDSDDNAYTGSVYLPGTTKIKYYASNIETVKVDIENTVTHWFNSALEAKHD